MKRSSSYDHRSESFSKRSHVDNSSGSLDVDALQDLLDMGSEPIQYVEIVHQAPELETQHNSDIQEKIELSSSKETVSVELDDPLITLSQGFSDSLFVAYSNRDSRYADSIMQEIQERQLELDKIYQGGSNLISCVEQTFKSMTQDVALHFEFTKSQIRLCARNVRHAYEASRENHDVSNLLAVLKNINVSNQPNVSEIDKILQNYCGSTVSSLIETCEKNVNTPVLLKTPTKKPVEDYLSGPMRSIPINFDIC